MRCLVGKDESVQGIQPTLENLLNFHAWGISIGNALVREWAGSRATAAFLRGGTGIYIKKTLAGKADHGECIEPVGVIHASSIACGSSIMCTTSPRSRATRHAMMQRPEVAHNDLRSGEISGQ